MTQVNQRTRVSGKIGWGVALAIVILLIAVAAWWRGNDRSAAPLTDAEAKPETPVAAEKPESEPAAPAKTLEEIVLGETSKDEALDQLAAAVNSVPDAKPLEGPVTQRPEFIAQFEWTVIQEMAEKDPDPETKRTELVNKLLFFKKWEAWRELLGDENATAKRHSLAREILAMMPAQEQVLGPEQIQEMKDQLLADLNGK